MITPIAPIAKVPETAGQAYGPIAQLTTAVSLTANTIVYYPVIIGRQKTFTSLVIGKYTTLAGNARMGLYSDNNGAPGALIVGTGSASLSAAGALAFAISQSLAPGLYWLAMVADVSTASFSWGSWYAGMGVVNGYMSPGYKQAYAFAALPANATPVLDNGSGGAGIALGIAL